MKRSMERLGVGIIGCGNISASYLRLAPLFNGLEVRGIADIRTEAAQTRAEEFGVRAYSVADLLGSDAIDVVVNLTVPDAHYSVSRSALEAGKHVYSEKPLVLTLEEGEALRDIAARKGLRIGSAPDTFLGGAHQLARARIDEGLVGRIVAGSAHMMSRGMEHWHPNPDFFFQPGAGPVLDVGIYYIANLIQFIGPVRRVAALASSARATRTILSEPRRGEKITVGTPTNIHALLEFRSGATITLSASWDVWAHRHGNLELYGLEGSLFVPDPNFFGGNVEYAGHDGNIVALDPWEHPLGVPNRDGRADYRTAGLAEMVQAMIDGRMHRCSLDLALHSVDVMTSILRAGEEGEWIELSTTCERPDPLGPPEARAMLA